jgi:hypothetical protein
LTLALFTPSQRPALLPGAAVLALLLASAALDGPVERYRYPLDPSIALLAAGGLTVGLKRLWRRLAPRRTDRHCSRRGLHNVDHQPAHSVEVG